MSMTFSTLRRVLVASPAMYSSPGELAEALRADSKKWGDVIAATGTTINQ
jgi:hypothetical protein